MTKDFNLGFIGLGNMAGAIIRGLRARAAFHDIPILGYDRNPEKSAACQKETGLLSPGSVRAVAEGSQVLVLAVKPKDMPALLDEISDSISPRQVLVSLAAGLGLATLGQHLPGGCPIVRAMPNINARVGASATGLCANDHVQQQMKEKVEAIFSAVGSVEWLEEAKIAAFSAIAGAGPAFAYLFVDALATAGIQAGLTRAQAQRAASQMLLGSAKLLLQSDEHPKALVDQVTSPGGTTIEGMQALTRLGFEHAVHQAIRAVIEKDALIQ